MAPHNKRKTMARDPGATHVGALAVLALVGAALLSGCAGLGGSHSEANRTPVAALQSDKTKAWTGDEFTFDAQASKDPDGNITSWKFDFGDGNQMTASSADTARVKHVYTTAAEYLVTLTVIDDGTHDGLEEKSAQDIVHIAVDERDPVAANVVKAQGIDAGSTVMQPFAVRKGADEGLTNLTLQNTLVTGSSEIRLRLHDPAGNVIAEKSVTLDSTAPRNVEMSGMLDKLGNHTLEISALSGSARATGELQVLYSVDPDLKQAA